MKKHYHTLGLEEGASQEAIQAAYDKLSVELDPKNNDNQDFFVEEYAKLQEAYKSLSNRNILATEKGSRNSNKKHVVHERNHKKEKPNIYKKNWMEKQITNYGLVLFFLICLAGQNWYLHPNKEDSLDYKIKLYNHLSLIIKDRKLKDFKFTKDTLRVLASNDYRDYYSWRNADSLEIIIYNKVQTLTKEIMALDN